MGFSFVKIELNQTYWWHLFLS